MRSRRAFMLGFVFLSLLAWPLLATAQVDARVCQDNPALSRMPNYYIQECFAILVPVDPYAV
jgi:hypothetical protein